MGRILAGIIGGLMVAILVALLVALATVRVSGVSSAPHGSTVFLIAWGAAFLMAMFAPSSGKAWRRVMLTCGILSLCLPLATMILTGAAVSEQSGSQAAGGLIAGGLMTMFSGFVGFFLGAIFLLIGFLSGRAPQVIYVQAPPSPPANL